jgi:hypothetical protein
LKTDLSGRLPTLTEKSVRQTSLFWRIVYS